MKRGCYWVIYSPISHCWPARWILNILLASSFWLIGHRNSIRISNQPKTPVLMGLLAWYLINYMNQSFPRLIIISNRRKYWFYLTIWRFYHQITRFAPRPGLEPGTIALTARRSTIELPRSTVIIFLSIQNAIQPLPALTRLQKILSFYCFCSRAVFFWIKNLKRLIYSCPTITTHIMIHQSFKNIFRSLPNVSFAVLYTL